MFLIGIGHAAVLLLILTKSFVLATLRNDFGRANTLGEDVASLLQIPWIDAIESFTQSTESSCAQDLAAVLEAFQSGQNWTLQLLDASSKLQSGVSQGNFRELGMYDQCVQIDAEYNDRNIQGQHCMVSYGSYSSSVCVPSSCSETEVEDLVSIVIENVTLVDHLGLTLNGVSCARIGNDFTPGEILTIVFFSLVGAFILSCTVCEFVTMRRPKGEPTVLDTLANFSLYKNGAILLNTEVNPKIMPAIQGMRFLSICWVVLGHRVTSARSMPMVNALNFLEWTQTWVALYILLAPFAVDTFFVISGFLMCYLHLKSKRAGKKSDFHIMYLHRYLRLTPAAAAVMLFYTVLLHRVWNGPIWETSLIAGINNCRQHWWVNLLYVQNYVGLDNTCLTYYWYLAVDMQLFWISPIILYPLHHWPKVGLGILGFLIVGSLILPAIVLAINSYTNAVLRITLSTARQDSTKYYYIATHTRACAYLIGCLLGYDVASNKRRLTKKNVVINWIVTCILLILCGVATKYLYDTDQEYNVYWEIVFSLTLRPFWAIAMAWIIYASTQGYAGPVGRFLSLPIFMPLSRLTYSVYLVHRVVQFAKVASVQTPDRFSDWIVLDHFWADIIISIVAAFFVSLFFESPVVVLEKILKAPSRKTERPAKKDVEGGIDNRWVTED